MKRIDIIDEKRFNLLKYLKICLDSDLKIMLMNHRNNYIEHSNIISNISKNFDNLTINFNVLYST